MSTNSWLTIMSLQPAGGQGRLSSGFQTPDRSGLPSNVRGAGAERSTAPLFVRGTFAVGYLTHCAPSGRAVTRQIETTKAHAARRRTKQLCTTSVFMWLRSLCVFVGSSVYPRTYNSCLWLARHSP